MLSELEIKALANSGKLRWSDMTPSQSVYDIPTLSAGASDSRKDEYSAEEDAPYENANVNKDKKKINERPRVGSKEYESLLDKLNEGRTPIIDPIVDAFKTVRRGYNLGQISNAQGKLKYEIPSIERLSNTLSEGQNDPDFFKYIDFVKRLNNHPEKMKIQSENRKSATDQFGNLRYVDSDGVERIVNKYTDTKKYNEVASKSLYSNGDMLETSLPGEFIVTPTRNTSISNSGEVMSSGKLGGIVRDEMNRVGRDYVYPFIMGASGMGALSGSAQLAGNFIAAGISAGNLKDEYDRSTGPRLRKPRLDEIPRDLVDAHAKYGDAVNKISGSLSSAGKYIPSIDEFESGTYDDNWKSLTDSEIDSQYNKTISGIKIDLEDLKRDDPSEYVKLAQEDPESIYNTLQNVGMSYTELEANMVPTAIALVTSIAGKKIPIPVSRLMQAAGVAYGLYGNWIARESEFNSSFDESYDQKQDNFIVKNGGTAISAMSDVELVNSLEDESKKSEYIKQINDVSGLSELNRKELELGIRSGVLKSTIKGIDESIDNNSETSKEYRDRYMNMYFTDVAPMFLAMMPVTGGGVLAKQSESIFKSILNSAEEASNYLANKSLLKFFNGTSVGKGIKGIKNIAISNIAEAGQELFLEEIPQTITDKDYVDGVLSNSNSSIESFARTYQSAAIGAMELFGLSGDPRYNNDGELTETAIQTLYSTLIMGAPTTIMGGAKTVRDMHASSVAKAYAESVVIPQHMTAERIAKAGLYIDKKINGKEQELIDYLEYAASEMKSNEDRENILKEIEYGKKALYLANNINIEGYANRGAGYGSEDHKLAVGLALSHIESASTDRKLSSEMSSEYEHDFNKEYEHTSTFSKLMSIPGMQKANARSIVRTMASLEAISDISFKSSTDTLGKIRSKTMSSNVEGIKNHARELLIQQLADSSVILPDEKASLEKNKKIDILEFLSDNGILDKTGINSEKLKISISAGAGAAYNDAMVKTIEGFGMPSEGKKIKKNSRSNYDLILDTILDAYRSSRKSENDEQTAYERKDDVSNSIESDTTDDTIEHDPVIETSSEDVTSDSNTQDTQEAPSKTTDAVKEANIEDDNKGSNLQEYDNENSSDYDDNRDDVKTLIDRADEIMSSTKNDNPDNGEIQPDNNQRNEKTPIASNSEISNEDTPSYVNTEDSYEYFEFVDNKNISGDAVDDGIRFDKLSHTLFTNSSNVDALEYLKSPNALKNISTSVSIEKADISLVPGDRLTKDSLNPYKEFRLGRKETWDDAVIKIKIRDLSIGKEFTFTLSMPDIAKRSVIQTANGYVNKFSESDISLLRDFRNKIIDEYRLNHSENNKKKLIATSIRRGKSKILLNRKNGRAVQRKLTDIDGLIDSEKGLISDNVEIGYGRGAKGVYDIVSRNSSMGFTREMNSGGIFIFKKDPVTGSKRALKINKKRFDDEDSTVDLIYTLAVEMRGSNSYVGISNDGKIGRYGSGMKNLGITASSLLSRIVNFGDRTIVLPEERDLFKHLIPKQFFIENGNLYLGDNKVNLSNISEQDKLMIKNYIKSNFNWTVDASHIWNENGNDNKVGLIVPAIRDFFIHNKDVDEIRFSDSMVFNRNDMNKTWLSWLIENGKLVSDIADGVFESPYLFIEDVTSVLPRSDKKNMPGSESNEARQADAIVSATSSESDNAKGNDANSGSKKTRSALSQLGIGKGKVIKNGAKSAIRKGEYSKIDIEKAKKWLGDKLGLREENDDMSIVDDVISLADGTKAMGLLTDSSIVLWAGAAIGTEYHEAFHMVSLLRSSRTERKTMYNEIRKNIPEMRYRTDKEVEEYLAEDYREWQESREKEGRPSSVRVLFRKIYNFINGARRLSRIDIRNIYKNIEYGLYKSRGVNANSLNEFKSKYIDGASKSLKEQGFDFIDSVDMKYDVITGLTATLFNLAGVNSISDVGNLKGAMERLKLLIRDGIEEMKSLSMSEATIGIWTDVLNNFEYFSKEVNKKIKSTGIYVTENDSIADDEADGVVTSYQESYYKEDYESPHSIPAEVRLFLETIPVAEWLYNEDTNEDELTQVVDPITGLISNYDGNISAKILVDKLGDISSYSEMYSEISRLADVGSDTFYSSLKYKLDESTDENFKTRFWSTIYSSKNEFINASVNNRDLNIDQSFRIADAKIDDVTFKMPTMWGENMIAKGNVFTESESGYIFNAESAKSIYDDYVRLASNINRLDSSKDKSEGMYDDAISNYVGLLNKLGIDIDMSTMNVYMENKYPGIPRHKAISNTITNTKSGTTSLLFTNILNSIINLDGKIKKGKRIIENKKDIYIGEGAVKDLASAHAKVHPTPEDVFVQGANNTKAYQISKRNYITDLLTKLRRDAGFLNSLIGVTYNSGDIVRDENGEIELIPGSMILSQIARGEITSIKEKPFLKFYEEKSGDPGRDYLSISKVEDYLIKASAIFNGYLPIPTMADKKRFYFIYGVKTFDFKKNPISYTKVDGGKAIIDLSPAVLNQFYGYFKSEYNAIKEAYDVYVKSMGDKRKMLPTYHYSRYDQRGVGAHTDKKGRWNSGLGNGVHFRHFDCVKISTSGSSSVVNLNYIMEEFVRDLGVENGMKSFFSVMDAKFFSGQQNRDTDVLGEKYLGADIVSSDVYTILKNTIVSEIRSEMAWLIDKGVIRTITNGNLDNVKLDKALSAKMNAMFKEQDDMLNNFDISNASILNMVASNVINTNVANIEFEKLVSKDPAFYKNPVDKTKRFSALLSTGTNLRTDFPIGHRLHGIDTFRVAQTTDNIVSSLQLDELKSSMLLSQFNELIRTSTGSTINDIDSIFRDRPDEFNEIKSKYSDQYSLAEKIVESYVSGYSDINETDATAFISPSMYMSIMERLGLLTKEMEDAIAILESSSDLWYTDSREYLSAMKVALNPLKMIYFGDKFENRLDIPQLNKMAMFVLFKQVSTGDLGRLYERMNDPNSPIHMVVFDSAVKVGLDRPFSFYKNKDNTEISDLSNIHVSDQRFEYLRHQMPTDPHEEDTVALATQVQKISLSNIKKDKIYKSITIDGIVGASGEYIAENWKMALSELSNRGAKNVRDILGIENDENGVPTVNKDKLFKYLEKESEDSGLTSDVIEYIENASKVGSDITLQGLYDNTWVESKIMSLIMKNTLDTHTPGGSFIQMSTFGLKSINLEDYDGSRDRYIINNGKPLNILNSDMSMDAVISIRMFKDVIPENIKKLSFMEQRNWLFENNIIGENSAPGAIGYRIPTQGMASISGIKIMDVLVENIGDTIILPSDFTKLTGSDFDIDKLYLARYNYSNENEYESTLEYSELIESQYMSSLERSGYIDKYGDYFDENRGRLSYAKLNKLWYNQNDDRWYTGKVKVKSRKIEFDDFLEDKWKSNSSEAIQNRLIDCMLSLILDKDTSNESRMPLDTLTDEIKNNILPVIDESIASRDKQVPFLFISPSYQSDVKDEYNTGKKNLGPFALSSTNHVMTQIAGIRFRANRVLSKFGIARLDNIYGRDNIRILDWLSAMINAHVDIAKDPFVIRLGVNSNTIKMSTFLIRTGFGSDTFYFLSQPILRNAYKIASFSEGRYGADENTDNRFESIVRREMNKYLKDAKKLANGDERLSTMLSNAMAKGSSSNKDIFDTKKLKDNLSPTSDFWHLYNQILVAKTFLELSPAANEVSELVKYSQIETKKAGNSFSSQYLFGEGIKRFIMSNMRPNSYIANPIDLYTKTFLDAKSRNSIDLASEIGNNLLFRTTRFGQSAMTSILSLAGMANRDNRKYAPTLSKYIDAKIKSEFFNNLLEESNVSIEDLFFGDNSVAKRLYRIKSMVNSGELSDLKNNVFLLNTSYKLHSSNDRNNPDHVSLINTNVVDPNFVEKIKHYFSELYNNSNKEVSDFARLFILYQFYSTGDNNSLNSVKISEELRDLIGYHRFVNRKLNEIKAMAVPSIDFISDIFKNRWYDNSIVPIVELSIPTGKYEEIDGEYVEVKRILPNLSTGNASWSFPIMFIGEDRPIEYTSDLTPIFRPYVKMQAGGFGSKGRYILYEISGIYSDYSSGSEVVSRPVYRAINKLGGRDAGLSVIEHGFSKSIIKSNNYLRDDTAQLGLFELIEKFKNNATNIGSYNDLLENITEYSISAPDHTNKDEEILILSNIDSLIESAKTRSDYSLDVDLSEDNYNLYLKGMIAWLEEGTLDGGILMLPNGDSVPESVLTLFKDKISDNSDRLASDESNLNSADTTNDFASHVVTREYTPENIASLKDNEIFVFGSNTEGRHGAGAALTAKNKFGAVYGKQSGLQGQSYAIVTKNLTPGIEYKGIKWNDAGERSVPLDYIGEGLADFFEFAASRPDLKFYVSKLGSSKAGYSVEEIRNQIKEVNDINGGRFIPENVILPLEYEVRDYPSDNESATKSVNENSPRNELFVEKKSGNKYSFSFMGDTLVSGEYSQGNSGEWNALSSAGKTYKRLMDEGLLPVSSIEDSTDNVSSIENEENKRMVKFGDRYIDLSRIGISYDLNDGQSSAINNIQKWIFSKGGGYYSLTGSAGTGKTSVTKIITRGLRSSGVQFVLASPTHKAKSVLSKATGEKAKTVHSLLGKNVNSSYEALQVGMNISFGGLDFSNMPRNGVLVIDEASMIGDEMLEDILTAATASGSRVIFIGDEVQLPPIKKSRSSENGKSRALLSDNKSTLYDVMRVANGNPMIDTFSAMRFYNPSGTLFLNGNEYNYSDIAKSTYLRRDNYNEVGGIKFVGEQSRLDAIATMIDKFKSDLFKENGNYAKFIAYRNSSVDYYNKIVREALGLSGNISEGERLSGQAAYRMKGKVLIENDDQYSVDKIGSRYVKKINSLGGLEVPVVDISISSTTDSGLGGEFSLLDDYSEEMILKIQEAIIDTKSKIAEIYSSDPTAGSRLNKDFYNDLSTEFITIFNIPNPFSESEDSAPLKQRTLRHEYAITAHKSQGSEFEHIFVDDTDIRRISGGLDDEMYRSALYTATSRARQTAIVVTNGQRYDFNEKKVIGQSERNDIPAVFTEGTIIDNLNKMIKEDGSRPSDKC